MAMVSALTGMPARPRAAGHLAGVGDAVPGQPVVLGLHPDGEAEGGGVFEGAQQRFGIDHRPVGLGKGDAAGPGQPGQFGQALALRPRVRGARG